jgi:3-methyladenine DNA glycosylase/8-oxoguanine DNA glycosylase
MHLKARRHLSKNEPRWKFVFEKIRPIKLEPREDVEPMEALCRSIIYQQLAGKAAATIYGRWRALFGSRHPTAEQILKIKAEKMRAAGVSANKQKALRDVAQTRLEGLVPSRRETESLSDRELIDHLTQVHGVGEWTVQMYLLFYLGRPDVWPVGDLGVRNGHGILLNKRKIITPRELEKWGEKFGPYRSFAALYLWRLADLKKAGDWKTR